MKKLILALASFALLAGCADDPAEAVQQHYDDWKSQGLTDYTFIYRRGCFCSFTDDVRVVVRGGEVIEVRSVLGGDYDDAIGQLGVTMDQLFDDALRYAKDEPHEFDISYGADYGYIVELSVDLRENVADDGFGYHVSCFAPGALASACPPPTVSVGLCSLHAGTVQADPSKTRTCTEPDHGKYLGVIDTPGGAEICCGMQTVNP
jgi:Family of unknown function (DUF6174)